MATEVYALIATSEMKGIADSEEVRPITGPVEVTWTSDGELNTTEVEICSP